MKKNPQKQVEFHFVARAKLGFPGIKFGQSLILKTAMVSRDYA